MIHELWVKFYFEKFQFSTTYSIAASLRLLVVLKKFRLKILIMDHVLGLKVLI